MPIRPFARGRALAALLCFALCAVGPAAARDHRPPAVVGETFVSQAVAEDELDSLATWRHPDGTQWLIASGKSSHRLVIFDAETGARLRTFGEKGSDPGRFKRPNGLAVAGDRLFVVERDNHRVQVFALPDFAPLGSFGEAQLRAPYGLWLNTTVDGADGAIDVYVTDSFMDGANYDVVPPLAQLDQRVRRYRVRFGADGALEADALGHFGDAREASALRMVESIGGDRERGTLLIADEFVDRAQRRDSTLREYTLDGEFTGRSAPRGSFEAEAEGVALWRCAKSRRFSRGFWIAVDQRQDLTAFRLFDRDTLAARGGFVGRVVAATDGIALRTAPSPRFPAGALFAVHRDKAVAAFDLRDVARALKLPARCP
ncbi:MAG: phytase [Xanthomonadaceae bacterium]|nr:phytase [Xanthomonadaceae bacterium]